MKELIHQPEPTGDGEIVAPAVYEFIDERIQQQLERYGTKLRTHNGRDALYDALQEAIDTVFYLVQAILERDRVEWSEQPDDFPTDISIHDDKY